MRHLELNQINPKYAFELTANPGHEPTAEYGPRQARILNQSGLAQARDAISSWPGYAPTSLLRLDGLADALGIKALYYKQEGERFGLASFKPLGGAYAVLRRLQAEIRERLNVETNVGDILAGKFSDLAAGVTVTAATDGNHGRSVAWGARMFGCRCVIFINEAVSIGRERAIAAYGAEVRRNPGSYDDAVRTTFETARSEGWHVVPDTTDGETFEAPRDVTQGYAVMAAEAIEQLPADVVPSHIFLQAGVGGMAAATCAQFWQSYGDRRPTSIIVEPEQSACWFHSLQNRRPTVISGDIDSVMAGLACGEISTLAWDILEPGAAWAMTVQDGAAEDCMRLLADSRHGDAPMVAGESGVAGLVGLIALAGDKEARSRAGLTETSSVIVFGTEGATDPEMYRHIVGRTPEEVTA